MAWRWIGPDKRGRVLDIVAVEAKGEADPEPVLPAIHAAPLHRGRGH